MRKPVGANDRTEFLENSHVPLMRDAYLTSIDNIVSNIELGELESLIGKGDIEGAYRSLHIDDIAFRPYDVSFSDTIEHSASLETLAMPATQDANGHKIVLRYDFRNIESARWTQEYLAGFISSITDEQRMMVKEFIQDGLNRGADKRSIALGIAGRIDPESRSREGGIIGLSGVQKDYVLNAHRELVSGTLDGSSSYLSRSLRDRRFDSVVKNTASVGGRLPDEVADKLTRSYANRLLRFRAGLIAKVESSVAINQGRIDAYGQAIRRGAFTSSQVEKTWRSQRDKSVRYSHKVLDHQSIALFDKFRSPTGALLSFPCDPMAPADERVACRCRLFIRVNGVTR